ncbi:MAG: GntR family transcriptional regulator [Woeseiaceae bacterium]
MDDILEKLGHRSIDASSPTPLYFQVYNILHDSIADGRLPNGAKIPSEKELAATFDVSRITARRALDELALKKMVVRHRGKGTFVEHRYQPDTIHAPLTDLMKSLGHMGRDTEVKVLELSFAVPTGQVQGLFKTDSTTKICYARRIRTKEDVPFGHYETWSLGFDRTLTKKRMEKHARLELFKMYDINIARVEQSLSAVAAPKDVAEVLNIRTGKPLLKLHRLSYDADGQLVDRLVALYNSDLFRYHMETIL